MFLFAFDYRWLIANFHDDSATGAGIARSYYLTRLFADPLRDLTCTSNFALQVCDE